MSESTPARRVLLMMPVFVLIAALYAAFVFYSRWHSLAEARRQAAEAEQQRLRHEVEMNGGERLKILDLYAERNTVRRCEAVQICYGVVNAKEVAFDPPVAGVWPSQSRCVEVKPKQSTTYTLTATDAAGHKEKAQVAIAVK